MHPAVLNFNLRPPKPKSSPSVQYDTMNPTAKPLKGEAVHLESENLSLSFLQRLAVVCFRAWDDPGLAVARLEKP